MTSPSDPPATPLTEAETVPVTEASRKPLLKLGLLIFAVVVACLLLYGLKDRVAWAQRADEPEAYALLIVEKQDSRFPFDKQEKETEADFDRYLHAQVVNLKNRSILNRALNKANEIAKLTSLKNNSDDLTWLEKNLGVTIVENTSILRVSLRGGNPEDNVAIVKGVIDAYLEETGEEEAKQRMKRFKGLNDMAAVCDQSLADQRRRLKDIAKVVNGGVGPTALKMAGQSLKEDLDAYRKEHLRIKMALTTARCTYDEKLKSLAMNGPGSQKPDRAEQISQLKEEIAVLQELEKYLDAERRSLEQQVNQLRDDSPDDLPSNNIDLMAKEQMLNRAITARLEIELEMKHKNPRVRVLQPAIVAKAK